MKPRNEPLSLTICQAMDHLAKSAINVWGHHCQMVKTCEELSELSQALCKRLNASPVTNEQIVTEIADVIIMAVQMRQLFGGEAVDEQIRKKIERTVKALSASSAERPGVIMGIAEEDMRKGQAVTFDFKKGRVRIARQTGSEER